MKIQKAINQDIIKAIAILAVCAAVIAVCGYVIWLTIVGFRATTAPVRIFAGILTLAIGILTIRTIINFTNFIDIWARIVGNLRNTQNSYERSLHKKYNALMAQYPYAIYKFESECWKLNPRPSTYEIIEMALKIDETEWAEREKVAKEILTSK